MDTELTVRAKEHTEGTATLGGDAFLGGVTGKSKHFVITECIEYSKMNILWLQNLGSRQIGRLWCGFAGVQYYISQVSQPLNFSDSQLSGAGIHMDEHIGQHTWGTI